ncbi:hypothetical protein N9383_00125 [Granulosicoccus sp.]|nr:hypothetical protein [Granulosicoccus sp.]
MDTVTSTSNRLLRRNCAASISSSPRSLSTRSIPVHIALVVITAFNTFSAHASSWQLDKGLDLSLGLVRSDGESVSSDTDRAIALSPYVALSRQSRSLFVNGRAGVTFRDIEGESNARVDPSVSLQAIATIVDNSLWLGSSSKISRRLINGSVIDDVFTSTDEAVNVYEFAIGPRWKRQLSRTVRVAGAYQFSTVGGGGSTNQGSDAHAVGLSMSKFFGDGRMQTGVIFQGQRDNFETGESASAELLIGIAAYSFRNNLTGRLLAGKDRLKSATDDFDENSTVYGAGVVWQPTRHLFIDAEYSQRVFGFKPAVSIGLQGRVSSIKLSWSRAASISQGLNFGGIGTTSATSSGATSQVGEIDTDLAAGDLDTTNFASFALESENVTEALVLTYVLQGRVSTFVTRLSRRELERLATAGGETANEIQFNLTRKLSRSMRAGFSIRAIDGETRSDAGTSNDVSRQEAFFTFSIVL